MLVELGYGRSALPEHNRKHSAERQYTLTPPLKNKENCIKNIIYTYCFKLYLPPATATAPPTEAPITAAVDIVSPRHHGSDIIFKKE